MNYVINTLIPVLGGLSNCYLRGGGLEELTKKNHWWGTPLFLLFTALSLYLTEGLSWFILSGTVAMWLGMAPGWGLYIGAVAGANGPGKEQKWIDWCIRPLEKHPRLWGFTGLVLRGLLLGSTLSLGTLNPLFIPLSLTMGLSYWLSYKILPLGKHYKLLDGWKLGEIIFGTIIFIGFIL